MPIDPSFRMTVEDVFTIRGRGTVATGKVETGTLKVGDQVQIYRGSAARPAEVTGIESFRKRLKEAKAGDNVGVLLKDVTKDDVQRGDVLAGRDPQFTWKP